MRRLTILLSLIAFSVSAFAQVWTPEMQAKLKAVGSPNVSPDGKRVVFTGHVTVMAAAKSE